MRPTTFDHTRQAHVALAGSPTLAPSPPPPALLDQPLDLASHPILQLLPALTPTYSQPFLMGGVSPLSGLEPVLFRQRVHRLTVYTLFEDTSSSRIGFDGPAHLW